MKENEAEKGSKRLVSGRQFRRCRDGCRRRRTSRRATAPKASAACRSRRRRRWRATSSPCAGTGSSRICCRRRKAPPSTASVSIPWDRRCIPVRPHFLYFSHNDTHLFLVHKSLPLYLSLYLPLCLCLSVVRLYSNTYFIPKRGKRDSMGAI